MPMRLEPDTLRDEVNQIIDILVKWKERLSEGIPEDELPANHESAEIYQYRMRGELMLCAERLTSVVETLES